MCKSPASSTGFDLFASSSSSSEPAEYKDMKVQLSYAPMSEGTCVLIRRGKPSALGELKANIILWDVAKDPHHKELFDIIVTDDSIVGSVLPSISPSQCVRISNHCWWFCCDQ
jgi:hypothetical protein